MDDLKKDELKYGVKMCLLLFISLLLELVFVDLWPLLVYFFAWAIWGRSSPNVVVITGIIVSMVTTLHNIYSGTTSKENVEKLINEKYTALEKLITNVDKESFHVEELSRELEKCRQEKKELERQICLFEHPQD